MAARMKHVDVGDLPDALRLAEEVERTGQPRLLKVNGRALAVLSPVASETSPPRRTRRPRPAANRDSGLLAFVGIADESEPSDGPTDVSSNKHKYLANALYAKSHPPTPE